MVKKKVTPAMINEWKTELQIRIAQERKMHIIRDIARRENLNYGTIYFWTMPQRFREKRRQYKENHYKQHLEKMREKRRDYAREHRTELVEYQRDRYADSKVKAHVSIQAQLRWQVKKHVDEVLPKIIPENNQPITIQDMADNLRYINNGITVQSSTLEKAIKNYLVHDKESIIKEVKPGKYIKIR